MGARRVWFAVAAGGCVVSIVLLGGRELIESPAQEAVGRHADSAGLVMGRFYYPVPADYAALSVTGHVGDTTIDALSVDGDTRYGEVVLRITVDLRQGGFSKPDIATGCYRYHFDFDHRVGDEGKPVDISCPSIPALSLAPPAGPLSLPEDAQQRLTAALDALPDVQRRDVDSVNRVVIGLFPSPVLVGVGPGINGSISIAVKAQDQCMGATIDAGGHPIVTPQEHGIPCQGG